MPTGLHRHPAGLELPVEPEPGSEGPCCVRGVTHGTWQTHSQAGPEKTGPISWGLCDFSPPATQRPACKCRDSMRRPGLGRPSPCPGHLLKENSLLKAAEPWGRVCLKHCNHTAAEAKPTSNHTLALHVLSKEKKEMKKRTMSPFSYLMSGCKSNGGRPGGPRSHVVSALPAVASHPWARPGPPCTCLPLGVGGATVLVCPGGWERGEAPNHPHSVPRCPAGSPAGEAPCTAPGSRPALGSLRPPPAQVPVRGQGR